MNVKVYSKFRIRTEHLRNREKPVKYSYQLRYFGDIKYRIFFFCYEQQLFVEIINEIKGVHLPLHRIQVTVRIHLVTKIASPGLIGYYLM